MAYRAEFLVGGHWYPNDVRFATKGEAERYASDKFMRWTMPSDKRAVECEGEVNYAWDDERGLIARGPVDPCGACGEDRNHPSQHGGHVTRYPPHACEHTIKGAA